MKMHPKDTMEFLNVTVYGTMTDNQTVKGVDLKKGDKLYWINTVFSKPNYGFLMTADGTLLNKGKDSKFTKKQIAQATKEALEVIKNGKLGALGMSFNF
jgi:hypothetical protein